VNVEEHAVFLSAKTIDTQFEIMIISYCSNFQFCRISSVLPWAVVIW